MTETPMGIVNLLTIFVLLGLVIGSLMFCRRVSERQLNNKLAKIRLTALDRRISNTWDVVEEMDRFSDYPQVVKILCQSLRIDMDRLVKLDSKFPDINASLVRLKRKEEDLDNALVEIDKLKESARINPASEDESRLAEVDRLITATTFDSDRERKNVRLYLERSWKIVHRLFKFRNIDRRKFSSINICLKVMDLFIGINLYVGSAELALENNDKILALGFYRQAQDSLIASSVPVEEKIHRAKSIELLIDDLLKAMTEEFNSQNESAEEELSNVDLEQLNKRYIYDLD